MCGDRAQQNRASTGRVEIRILAHLPLHFLAFFFVVEEDFAVTEVAAFDFALEAVA